MKWKGRRESSNVEDRRMSRGKKAAVGTGGGVVGIIIMLVAIFVFDMKPQDANKLRQAANQIGQKAGNAGQGGDGQGEVAVQLTPQQQQMGKFVATVLADTEDVWHELFRGNYRLLSSRSAYIEPKLVMFTGQVKSACGFQNAAVGPFYCPADRKVYIDLSFYEDLSKRHNAPGDFAQAYVIAHEVGHHVQNILGISDQVHRARRQVSEAEYNELSVRLELQADFFAGVFAHHAHKTKNILEQGDIREAMIAAAAIGDDRLQMEARGFIVPESFTHGTSEQRVRWFKRGLETGDVDLGNLFDGREL